MSARSVLKKAAMKLMTFKDPLFSCSTQKQREYLARMPEPRSLIQRSWLQYRCQMMLYGNTTKVFLNILSLPSMLVLMLCPCAKSKMNVSDNYLSMHVGTSRAVFLREGKDKKVLPESLLTEFNVLDGDDGVGGLLLKEDKRFIRRLLKEHPFSWHYIFKIQLKIAQYRCLVETYNPTALICCSEYSFASSAATQWCHLNQLQHINVMHGDKLFYIRDSFFSFDRCYVWSKEYIKLFHSLRAEQKQFVVEIPPALSFKTGGAFPKKDFTYYLGSESGERLEKINHALSVLVSRGHIVTVRPHPRYSNKEEIQAIFLKSIAIEDPQKTTIEESLNNTRVSVSLYSTSLLQAYFNGIEACIDDFSDPERYEALIERDYILARLSPLRLSHYI